MSFSSDVKQELARQFPEAYHCLIAEAAAILRFAGTASGDTAHGTLLVETESVVLAKKYLRLIKAAFDISVDLTVRGGASGKTHIYRIELSADDCATAEDEDMPSPVGDSFSRVWRETADWGNPDFAKSLLEYSCCRRAFLRGAFLAAGSMSDPGKSYHFEIVCRTTADVSVLTRVIETFDLSPKQTVRKQKFLVYFKDSEAIVDMLHIMGATGAPMNLENARIIKGMKNDANRQSNCDAANIGKTVRAAARQLEDIRLIEREAGLDSLPPQLREMAEVRLEHPEESLAELGEYLFPPVGKSGVNHRLSRLAEIAARIRQRDGARE